MGATAARLVIALVVASSSSVAPTRATSVEAITADRTVFVIGDSLTFLAQPNVSTALTDVGWAASHVDAFEGRGVDFTLQGAPDTGLRAIDSLRSQFGDDDDWIVALGTNEVLFRDRSTYSSAIRHMLDRIGAGRRVMWVNTYLPDHPVQQAAWNAALDQAAAERNGDLVVYDWASVNAQHPEWMLYDNVHHNVEGNAAWARAIGDASSATLLPARPTSITAPTIEPAGASTGYVPVGPERILDTRIDGVAVAPRSVTRIDVSAAVPAGTNAIAINLTIVGYAGSGYATAFPCALGVPDTSTVNFIGTVGTPQSTSTIVQVDADEALCVYTNWSAHVVVDLFGAFVQEGGLPMTPAGPTRMTDTRSTSRPVLAAGSVLQVPLPMSADGVIVNLTVDRIGADGYLTAWPCTQARPIVSNLNYAVSERQKANVAVVPIGPDGMLCIFNNAPAAIIVDLLGVFAKGLPYRFHPVNPTRVLDTRTGLGGWSGHTAPDQDLSVGPLGQGPDAVAVGSVTATNALGAGYVTTWSGAGAMPSTSEVNFVNGTTRPNMMVVETAADATFTVTQGPAGRADVIVDITGWFSPT